MDLDEAESLVLSFVPGRVLTERDCAALRAVIEHRDGVRRMLAQFVDGINTVRVDRRAGRPQTGSGA